MGRMVAAYITGRVAGGICALARSAARLVSVDKPEMPASGDTSAVASKRGSLGCIRSGPRAELGFILCSDCLIEASVMRGKGGVPPRLLLVPGSWVLGEGATAVRWSTGN